MNLLSFTSDFDGATLGEKDVLSAFKPHSQKPLTIHQGMSVQEISDVVSDKIIAVVKEQFQATKDQFLAEDKK